MRPTPDMLTNGSEAILTVSEFVRRVSFSIARDFPHVFLRGEISSFKAASSGHVYFLLKDADAQLGAVMFRSTVARLPFRPENGLEVIVAGEPGLYEKRGDFRLVVQQMEPAGIGSLQLAFEQLKARLEAEGLFEAALKKKLPLLPAAIGVVTSMSGAALQDIIKVLRRRMPSTRIILAAVPVQGAKAAPAIAAAIDDLNRLPDVELLIVGRGGGSIEDLWAFNEEIVARAMAASRLPIISAVGHETDFTIADFVADLRAPTPSAAAEMAVPDGRDLWRRLQALQNRASLSISAALYRRRQDLRRLVEDYVLRRFPERLQHSSENIERLRKAAGRAVASLLSARQAELSRLAASLQALDPLATLSRGYSITRRLPEAKLITRSQEVAPGDLLETVLAAGSLRSRVTEVNK